MDARAVRRLPPAGLLLCTLLAPACVTPRFIPKRAEPISAPRQALPADTPGVKIKQLSISCRSHGDSRNHPCGPQRRLLELASRVGSGVEDAFPTKDRAAVEASIEIEAVWSAQQTFVFDVLWAVSGGLFPLVPRWGNAELSARIVLTTPSLKKPPGEPVEVEDRPFGAIKVNVKVPYNTFWYSWYRGDAAGRAFDDGWRVLARTMIARLGANLSVPAKAQAGTWTEPLEGGGPDDEVRGETVRPNDIAVEESNVVVDRGEDWHLLTAKTKRKTTAKSLFHKYLSVFSGLEAGYFVGKAWVQSDVIDDLGRSYTIAAGEASSRGYRIGFYTIPEKSDWFLFPTLGFYSLDIDIHDFREKVPVSSKPGMVGIPAVGSDPTTGAPVDLGDPNVYRLEMRSIYLGQRLSGTLVYGTPKVQVFGTLEGGVNLFEVRYTRAYLGSYNKHSWSAAFARSAAVRGIVGVAVRPWHVAFRVEANYEAYFKFALPEGMDFNSRVEKDADGIDHRPVITVKDTASGTMNVFFGANLYY